MSNYEQGSSKAQFKAALEKKKKVSRGRNTGIHSDNEGRKQESSGHTPKMFRRKSGQR